MIGLRHVDRWIRIDFHFIVKRLRLKSTSTNSPNKMCNSNAPTSLIEQGIVVRCHSGSFISNGLEKKTANYARSRNSSVALKPSVCEKEYLVRVAIPRNGRKKDLKRKTCKRPSSLEEESFSRSCFVDNLGSHCLCWFQLVPLR